MVGSSVSEDSSNPLHLSLSRYYWMTLKVAQQLLLLHRGYLESYKDFVHTILFAMHIHAPYNFSTAEKGRYDAQADGVDK